MKKRTLKFKRDVVGKLSPSQLANVTGGITIFGLCNTIYNCTRTNTEYTCGSCSSETNC